MSMSPSSFESAASPQGKGSPLAKSRVRENTASEMSTSPVPFASPRMKLPRGGVSGTWKAQAGNPLQLMTHRSTTPEGMMVGSSK
jgi:hypothetical protein